MEFPQMGSGPNRQQIIDALRNTAQSASNNIAETASMPVDALAWALRKVGVPVGDKPVMGSDWMREKGLTAPVQEGASKVVGDTIGMISPMGLSKQGAKAMIDAGSKLKGLPVGNMFIGETAKTWDEVAAAQAKMMEKQGKTPQQIWKDTGTFKGADGKYRQEIDDSLSRLDEPTLRYFEAAQANSPLRMDKLSGVLSHKKAYGAYPETQNIGLDLTSRQKGGAYAAQTSIGPEAIALGQAPDSKSTLLHELQHAIQQREGFARGGSMDDFYKELKQPVDNAWGRIEQINQEMKLASGTPKYEQLMSEREKLLPLVQTDPIDLKNQAYQKYKNLAGEAEARATQKRMNMDATQRREVFPYDSYDVPVNQLIVK